MLLTELAISDEQTIQIFSSENLDSYLVAAGAKQLKPQHWFFPGNGKKSIKKLMQQLADRGIFTFLEQ
jgi:hypothetical protein